MSKIRFHIIVIHFSFAFFSCQGQQEEKPKPTTYFNHHINWSIALPSGWEIKKLLTNYKKDTLFSFVKSQYNEFSFTVWPYSEEKPGDFILQVAEENLRYYNGIKSAGLRADSSSGKDIIGGKEFLTWSVTAYAPGIAKPTSKIIFYSRLIKGRHFRADIQFGNEANFNEIYAAFKNSKFE